MPVALSDWENDLAKIGEASSPIVISADGKPREICHQLAMRSAVHRIDVDFRR